MESAEPPVYHRFPPEIRNQLFRCAVLPEQSKTVQRSYKSISKDGSRLPLDTVHAFYIDAVTANGSSTLFSREITKVAEIAEELLTLVTPWILFTFKSPDGLRLFAETFYEHSRICKRKAELHVELDFTSSLGEADRESLEKWEETDVPHGKKQHIHSVLQEWLEALSHLPTDSTHVHLLMPQFWRDFRSLRGLSAKTGLAEFQVSLAFLPNLSHAFSKQDYDFFIAQTIAAVYGIEVVEQAGINKERREKLVRYGCRGFNRPANLTMED